jgi:rhodanese-related sulfurtransferase
MKKTLWLFPAVFCLAACEPSSPPPAETDEGAESTEGAQASVENVDAKAASALLKENSDLVVLDIRTPEEFAEGHIEGAQNVDFKSPDFESKLSQLNPKGRYLMHCRSGARSTSSLPTFEKLGFENLIHLNTGFNDWVESGLPVAK